MRLRNAVLILTFILAACSDPVTPRSANGFEVLAGPPPLGAPGWKLRDTLAVQLVDDAGEPFHGVPIQWNVQAGGGSVEVLPDSLDDGISRVVWTLGPTRGENRLSASAPGDLRVTFETVGTAFSADRVAAGYAIGCGLVDGALWCWGQQSGYLTPAPSEEPLDFGQVWEQAPGLVDGSREYVDVATTSGSACALDTSGAVWCTWQGSALVPVTVEPLSSITGAGWRTDFCGLAASDSTAWCWGSNDGAAVQIPGSPAFTSLGVYYRDELGCGLLADSTAACWGEAPLGDGTAGASAVPVAVAGGRHFAEIVVGDRFACAREADGDVWCWGIDAEPILDGPVDVPDPVLATTGATAIAADGWYAAALTAGGIERWYYALPDDALPLLTGLEHVGAVSLAPGSSWCVQSADRQTYCIAEMQFQGTPNRYDDYVPIQPVIGK